MIDPQALSDVQVTHDAQTPSDAQAQQETWCVANFFFEFLCDLESVYWIRLRIEWIRLQIEWIRFWMCFLRGLTTMMFFRFSGKAQFLRLYARISQRRPFPFRVLITAQGGVELWKKQRTKISCQCPFNRLQSIGTKDLYKVVFAWCWPLEFF